MPKRKVKEEKPRKKLGKKEILIPPIAMGCATILTLLIIPHFAPPPSPTRICLKGHNVDPFNVYPTVQVVVDGKPQLLPNDVGKQLENGAKCLHIIHTDATGTKLHIEFVRPIRLTMADFMKIYSHDNNTISVLDNSTGIPHKQILRLHDFNIQYSYFSEKGVFTKVQKPSEMPPFTNNMVARLELSSK